MDVRRKGETCFYVIDEQVTYTSVVLEQVGPPLLVLRESQQTLLPLSCRPSLPIAARAAPNCTLRLLIGRRAQTEQMIADHIDQHKIKSKKIKFSHIKT